MADLIAMQPNLNLPLDLVAPDEPRARVVIELNRPTFSRLSPRSAESSRFTPFSALRERLTQVAPCMRYLRPDFPDGISQSCEVEEAWWPKGYSWLAPQAVANGDEGTQG
jgi:hypothetical protein